MTMFILNEGFDKTTEKILFCLRLTLKSNINSRIAQKMQAFHISAS